MKLKPLKTIRVTLASIIIFYIGYKLVDFNSFESIETHILFRSQFIPALLSASLLWIVFILMLTLLLGRVYCSVLCPLGILQDIISRISKFAYKLTSKKQPKLGFTKSNIFLKYAILLIIAFTLLLGSSIVLTQLDPYHNFARISTGIFKPIVIHINDFATTILTKNNSGTFQHISNSELSISSFVIALCVLLIITIAATLRGRLLCNTICPVGALLSIVSKNAVIRPIINKNKCTNCGECESHCKSQCIDSTSKKIDASRCVVCMNCIGVCKNNAIKYTLPIPATQKIYQQNTNNKQQSCMQDPRPKSCIKKI